MAPLDKVKWQGIPNEAAANWKIFISFLFETEQRMNCNYFTAKNRTNNNVITTQVASVNINGPRGGGESSVCCRFFRTEAVDETHKMVGSNRSVVIADSIPNGG